MAEYQLVTICLLTYNSSKYVLETLESIKEQKYQNLELIISDDCSKDNTVEVCKEWLSLNKERFVSFKIIEIERNTGIPANCNRGLMASNGQWIKYIAGDDCLLPNCINEYIEFIKANPHALVCCSGISAYKKYFKEECLLYKSTGPRILRNLTTTAWQQFCALSFRSFIYAPTVFINKQLLLSLGGFDENIKLCEDWPMWLKITFNGYCFYYLDSITVKYRVYDESVYGREFACLLFGRFYSIEKLVYDGYIKGKAPYMIQLIYTYYYYTRLFLDKIGANKKNIFCKTLYRLVIAPYTLMSKFYKI